MEDQLIGKFDRVSDQKQANPSIQFRIAKLWELRDKYYANIDLHLVQELLRARRK